VYVAPPDGHSTQANPTMLEGLGLSPSCGRHLSVAGATNTMVSLLIQESGLLRSFNYGVVLEQFMC
jgi:hypothetical protein